MRRKTYAAAAAAGLLASLLAACGETGTPATGDASPSKSSESPRSTAPITTGPVDPEHAVPLPGPRKDPLVSPDLLVFDQSTLSPDMIKQINALDGVTKVESFSLAQVSLQDHAVNIAAVDPAGYRLFTPYASAELQEEWDRVAGGEVAILPRLGKQMQDADGYVKLGASAVAPIAHVGAYAPQVPQVSAVVNESWIKDLGMVPGNALLIATGMASPQSVRPKIQKIVGDKASIQAMDAVARFGLDPSVQQTAYLVGSAAEAVGSFNYTVLAGGRIAPDPAWVAAHIETRQMPIIGAMTCNEAMFPQLEAALAEVQSRGFADKIHPSEYGGCFVPRFIAGTTTLSNHAFGLALDVNVPGNQRGTVGEIDRTVVSIFEKWGFTWGGNWRWTDPMHFEMNAIVHPT
jgi:hypothetical protein